MEFTFYPYEGFGPVKFLMSRDEVRKIIGLPYKDVTRMTLCQRFRCQTTFYWL